MQGYPVFYLTILIGIVVICGCLQTAPENNSLMTTNPPAAAETAIPSGSSTILSTPTTIPIAYSDPVIGTWMCYSYSTNGRIKKVFTFLENKTYTRTITNLKSRVQGHTSGTWKTGGPGNYLLTSSTGSTTFQYDSTSDELYLPLFKETYQRISDADNPLVRVPTLNITLLGVQSMAEIQGSRPFSGKKFLVITVSIENVNDTDGFSFDDNSIWVMSDDGHEISAMNNKEEGRLSNPFPSGTIEAGASRQGNIVFAVPENTHAYTVKLVDSEAEVISNKVTFESILTTEA